MCTQKISDGHLNICQVKRIDSLRRGRPTHLITCTIKSQSILDAGVDGHSVHHYQRLRWMLRMSCSLGWLLLLRGLLRLRLKTRRGGWGWTRQMVIRSRTNWRRRVRPVKHRLTNVHKNNKQFSQEIRKQLRMGFITFNFFLFLKRKNKN